MVWYDCNDLMRARMHDDIQDEGHNGSDDKKKK